jgi:transcriptional regulator with XRE-family HTH domain
MGFGEHVRARRLELGLDQLDLAQKLAVAQSSVCDWENGKMRPHRSRLPQLAKALRVPAKKVTSWWLAV